jgi:NAD(P)-dependent dehydrogenase (short-subunit alcohol dehydrogenase family)
MDADRGGSIVNLGSNAGRKGRALAAHYAAAKAAVKSVTESLALAYGPKRITVNTVCPAVTETPMWEVKDVANLITFLASDKGSFVNGQEINVCGGFMLTS